MNIDILNVLLINKIAKNDTSKVTVDIDKKRVYSNDNCSQERAFCLSGIFRYLDDICIEPMREGDLT